VVNDQLILDISLTGMNGFDFLDKIEEKGVRAAVIVVSAFSNPKNREHCIEYGIKASLRKPVVKLFGTIKKPVTMVSPG